MSFFGTRRSPRPARVFRPSPSLIDRIRSATGDYRFLTQLIIAILAIILLLFAVQAWKSRFTFRSGQFTPMGVQARVDFEIENILESRAQRKEAQEAAPLVLVQDSTVLDRLQSQLRDQLSEIANALTVEDVSSRTLQAFGLDSVDAATRQGIFQQLKSLLTERGESSGSRIDELQLQYSQLMADAKMLGVIDTISAQRLESSNKSMEQKRSRAIQVVKADGEPIHYGVLADVLLQEQLKETGRLGKLWPRLQDLNQVREPIENWLQQNLKNQLKLDARATEETLRLAGEGALPVFDPFPRGTVLVPAGAQLNINDEQQQMELLWSEYDRYELQMTWTQRWMRVLGTGLLLALLVLLFGAFLKYSSPELLSDTTKLLGFVVMCALAVFLSCTASRDPWRAEIVPLMAAVMITSIAYTQVIAIMTAFCLSLLISMATLADLGHFVMLITVSLTSIIPLRQIKSRMKMIRTGFLLALVAFYVVWGVSVIQAHGAAEPWKNPQVLLIALKFAGWALVCCYLVAGSLPFIESAFGIVTDISLLELTAVSHPLLQELARRAPGTYNHSMTVATIAEAAADSIGANGLLTRVGAYFHDIGKMTKPEYFIENMTEGSENHHKSLAPAMSTLIIIGHVKEGLELAEENNLPDILLQFIGQHHGTTLVEYFFHEATRKADEDHRTDADEASFRYPGPKPQSREAAVLMLADAVESASRTLTEPTPRRIQSLVHEISMKRLLDGQFDECDIKMTELRAVEESLIKSLLAAHHGRVRYPGQKTA
ncbi:MAG: HD family phosphohydrolase [Planctomyces sp.]|jgi:putative nucleotidyltransferase with HDIG domain